ncbi:MerR family transcriptional regulator [Kineosporia mesophila]|uniref:MerR family transcriptional regulator n=1 Tax=Kineosporia mesophila TaxID=566012 RepID=A0ABP6ZEB4_9ACTN|nr:MerR family transcriptional regulator [Kineosporia mesophila]MCD5352056.1 MerR family transcriptional regulator [Kineosporia mesophila]
MRSAEIARLAGVSVRTLRHYHQLGVLPEPARSLNGYREYGVRELVRVLRLRHLQAAGFSLEAAAALLDDEPGGNERLMAVLDDVERDLDRQIAELTAQRALIARARALGTVPDLPAHLLRFAPLLLTASPRLARSLREQLAFLAHLEEGAGTGHTEQMMDILTDPALMVEVRELGERLEHLAADDADGISALADDFHAFLTSPEAVSRLGPVQGSVDPHWLALIDTYARDALPSAQLQMLARLERLLARGPCLTDRVSSTPPG